MCDIAGITTAPGGRPGELGEQRRVTVTRPRCGLDRLDFVGDKQAQAGAAGARGLIAVMHDNASAFPEAAHLKAELAVDNAGEVECMVGSLHKPVRDADLVLDEIHHDVVRGEIAAAVGVTPARVEPAAIDFRCRGSIGTWPLCHARPLPEGGRP